jgi:hypothetical protein
LPGAIDQYAQDLEELWDTLDLIDDHQTFEPLEGEFWVGEGGEVGGILQVEPGGWCRWVALGVHPGEGGLAALAGAQDGYDGMDVKVLVDEIKVAGSVHGRCVKTRLMSQNFHG